MNNFLCLHGIYQNSFIIKRSMKPILSLYNADGIFIDAPIKIDSKYLDKDFQKKLKFFNKDSAPDQYCGWWINNNINTDNDVLHYISREIIQNSKKNIKINGVIGISQGASLASLLLTKNFHKNFNLFNNGITIDNGIFISGFLSSNDFHKKMYNDGFVFSKNYHIYGYEDKVIKPIESIGLYEYMVKSNDNINKLLRHDGGHIIKHYLK